jgi:outer membrane lipoprotein LolB
MNSRLAARAAFAAACASLMVGCPSMPQRAPVEPQSWETRRAELQAREYFELAGRVAVASGEEGFNARLRWQQSGPVSELALDGPLGAGGLRLTSDGTQLVLTNARGERLDAEAARAEVERRLGFEPPLASLRYWVLGVPDPASAASEELDSEARLARLEQNGWNIEYSSYAPVDGRWLPQKLTLRRDDVRVRLLIERWQPS